MGTLRNIINELKSMGTPTKNFADMHIKFTNELINYSYEEIHKIPPELFMKKISVDFEILRVFAKTNLRGNETFHLYLGGPNDVRTVNIEQSLFFAHGLLAFFEEGRLLSRGAILQLYDICNI